MKKQVFTLMTTIALLSASPVLAMDYSAKDDMEEVKRVPVTLHAQPTLSMFKEIKKYGYFDATDGRKFTYSGGNPVEQVVDYLSNNSVMLPWKIIVLRDLVSYSLPNPNPMHYDYIEGNTTIDGAHISKGPSFEIPLLEIMFAVSNNHS